MELCALSVMESKITVTAVCLDIILMGVFVLLVRLDVLLVLIYKIVRLVKIIFRKLAIFVNVRLASS